MSLFVPTLLANGRLRDMAMTLCLVGSRPSPDDAGDPFGQQGGWPQFGHNLSVYGFEADAECCRQTNADNAARNLPWRETHFPVGLWDTAGTKTLHVTDGIGASSLFPPDTSLLDRYLGTEFIRPVRTVDVETTTMDAFFAGQDLAVDFMQIDVQGGELNVMRGGEAMIGKGTLAIVCEVEWNQMYVGQPLFGEVDTYMRSHGMSLFHMTPSCTYLRRGIPFASRSRPGMPIWCNAFYMRDLVRQDQPANDHLRSPEHLLKLACIADVLDFHDFATEVLIYLTRRWGHDPRHNYAHDIVQSLNRIPQLAGAVPYGIPALAAILPFLNRPGTTPTAIAPAGVAAAGPTRPA